MGDDGKEFRGQAPRSPQIASGDLAEQRMTFSEDQASKPHQRRLRGRSVGRYAIQLGKPGLDHGLERLTREGTALDRHSQGLHHGMAANGPVVEDFCDRLEPPGQADFAHDRIGDRAGDTRQLVVEGIERDDVRPLLLIGNEPRGEPPVGIVPANRLVQIFEGAFRKSGIRFCDKNAPLKDLAANDMP